MNFGRARTRSRRTSANILVSSEKWRSNNRKISQKEDEYLEEDSDDDLLQASQLQDWFEEFFVKKNIDKDIADQDVEVKLTKKQTLVLATLVPDEILITKNFNTNDPKRFVGVLMMADVSGYTALSEKYNNSGKSGTYRLTVTLNNFLGSLVEVIYGHGGDIIKFAGDAFLALWKTNKKTFLCHTIHNAITCALIIQHCFGSYETDMKVHLKVKLAISAGNLIFTTIGSGIDMNYIIIGLPIIEAKVAESLCASGEVKLTPTAWAHCYSRNYDHFIDEDNHVTIKAILYDPRENNVSKPFLGFGSMMRSLKKPFVALENLSDKALEDLSKINLTSPKKSEMLSLRKTILIANENNIGSEIRKFMIRPVLTQIEAHQPLEYLTEMRQVSVLFVTLKPKNCPFPQLITIINNSYQITCDIVYKSMGCVNKIILFDKDIMILVIFGLRGYKHESEAQAALKCAYSIKKSVSALNGVINVSIGVTTGQVYCGVVGHPLRREFTVIGAIVNKAARLMCCFRNKITCDEATYVKSKMSSNGFTLQPTTTLKGIIQPGKIYEYTEEIRAKELQNIPLIPPLLNRCDEMEYFENWLDGSHLTFRDFDALLLIGESRIGKTRLLEWMARYGRSKHLQVCYLTLTSIHSATPYLALNQIMDQILDVTDSYTEFEKEEKIVNLLKYYCDDLCYLNTILKVRFAYNDGISSINENLKHEKTKDIFKKILACLPDTYLVLLDDLQNLDAFSWDFLCIMLDTMKIFTVLSVTRGKFCSIHNWLYNVFAKSNIRRIVLGTLSSKLIIPLACQLLDVNAVSKDLCSSLESKCNGMPGLVESFIVHLFSNGALEIKKINKNDLDNTPNEDLHFPDNMLLRPVAFNTKDQTLLDQIIQETKTEELTVCYVTHQEQLNIDINIQNVDAFIMMQIDSLTPYQQLLLKIASVIGNIISRGLLENIMYENNSITTAKAVKRLFAMRILSCANVKYNKITSNATILSTYSASTILTCDCFFEYDPQNYYKLPKYAFCKVMKFRNKNSRKTFYELLPLNQKKEFHLRIVNYLDNNKQKCPDCGGTVMIVQSSMNFQPDVPYSKQYNLNGQFDVDSNRRKSQEDCKIATRKLSLSSNEGMFKIQKTKSESLNKVTLSTSFIGNPTKSETSIKKISQCNPILKVKSSCEDDSVRRRSTKRVTMSNMVFKDYNSDIIYDNNLFENLRGILEAENINDWCELGIIDSEDKLLTEKNEKLNISFSIKMEKDASKTNFSKCTCTELNITIFEQLIQHAKAAEVKTLEVEFLIKFCHFNILENNFSAVIPKLEEAKKICFDGTMLSKLDRKRFLGKIYTLKAASYMLNDKPSEAKYNLEEAAKIYRVNLNKVFDFLHIGQWWTLNRINRHKHRLHIAKMKADSVFFLNIATVLYSTLENERLSRIAALRSIYLVQKNQCTVIDLCDAFSNIIQMELDRRMPDMTIELETKACSCLKSLKNPIAVNELFAVGKLLIAIFRARTVRGELAAAIRSGFRALVISRFLHANKILVDVIPDLFYLLLARSRIGEAVGVVKLLLQLGENQTSTDCETWYYALCIDIILDAGIQIETPHEISRYAEFALARGKPAGESRRRLVTGLWTYSLRTDSDHKAKKYEIEVLNWTRREESDGSLRDIISGLRLAEGMLESLARKIDDLRRVVDLMQLRSLADKELTSLEKDACFVRAIYPRWILLKANSVCLSGRITAAAVLFNKASEEAKRIKNRLEEALVLANNSNVETTWCKNGRYGQFLNWNEATEYTKTSWHEFLYKINRNF